MDLGIKNKVAFVASSSRGLGKAVALRLSMEGAKVAVCGRNEQPINSARDDIISETGGEVLAVVGDVTDKSRVKAMIQEVQAHFKTIDILVCNAGGPPAGMYEDFSISDYEGAIELNLISTINLCYEVIPLMKKNSWGRIINITSISAKQPIDNLILSNTARAGVLGFSKSISNQLAGHGITVNCVCPGYTKTERVNELAKKFAADGKGSESDFFKNIAASIPAGRLGTVDEFAQTTAFLASVGAGYITGAAVQIDGGYNRGLF